MATMNPLERKARNSFIKGIAIAGIIGIIAVIALLMIIMQMRGAEQERLDAQVTIYALNQDVKSGQLITEDMLSRIQIDGNVVPANAVENVSSYFLVDQDGNTVGSVIDETTGEPVTCVSIDGQNYAINNLDGNTGTVTINGQTRTIVIEGTPAMAKIDMSANTILTSESIAESFELTSSSTRKQEYNMLSLPADIETDDIVDVRLRMPDGTDYIVVSKKRITVLEDQAGMPSLNTVSMELEEDEILMLSNAIVESYMMDGSRLYVTRYVEAGMQDAAVTTYIPSGDVQNLIYSNPNIVEEAKRGLQERASSYSSNRDNVNSELGTMNEDERQDAVTSGTTQEINDGQDARQSYLDSMQ